MSRRVGSAFVAAIGFFALFAERETPAQVAGFDPEALAKQFVGYDVSRNAGKGYSESASSATLAWGESYLLNASYGERARDYLGLIEERVLRKQERH